MLSLFGFSGAIRSVNHSRVLLTWWLVILVGGMVLVGCGKRESTIKVESFNKPLPEGATAPTANLPAPPPASAFVVKERNDDGSLRIRGLTHYQEKYLGQEVMVKGVISYVSDECDPTKLKEGETCVKAHFQIKDNIDSPKFLQAVGYPRDFLKKVPMVVGEEHLFKGVYTKQAAGFVNSGDGLLKLLAVDETEVYPNRAKQGS